MPSSFDGSVQGKTRPVIIMSNDLANEHSTCLLAIPCTTSEKKSMPTHTTFEINNNVYSTALAENLMSINVNRLGDYMGMMDDDLLTRLEYTVMVALGLEKYTHIPSPLNPIPIESQINIMEHNIEPDIHIKYKDEPNNYPERNNKEIVAPHKMGRPSTYTDEDKIRFINDYENHTAEYMCKKYNLKDKKALANKVYLFRKSMGIKKNKRS